MMIFMILYPMITSQILASAIDSVMMNHWMIKTSSYNDEHLIMMKSKRTYFTYDDHQGNVNDELQFE